MNVQVAKYSVNNIVWTQGSWSTFQCLFLLCHICCCLLHIWYTIGLILMMSINVKKTVPSMRNSLCALEIPHGRLATWTHSLNGYSHYQQVEDFGHNLVIWFTSKYCPSIKRERERESVGIQLRPPFNAAYVLFLCRGTSSLLVRVSFLLVFRRSYLHSPCGFTLLASLSQMCLLKFIIISQLHIATQIETQ